MSIGKAIEDIVSKYRRVIAFRELLGLFRHVIQSAPCCAHKMQSFGGLNVEISQAGRKLRSFFVKIDE
jgi:hypothetical protein